MLAVAIHRGGLQKDTPTKTSRIKYTTNTRAYEPTTQSDGASFPGSSISFLVLGRGTLGMKPDAQPHQKTQSRRRKNVHQYSGAQQATTPPIPLPAVVQAHENKARQGGGLRMIEISGEPLPGQSVCPTTGPLAPVPSPAGSQLKNACFFSPVYVWWDGEAQSECVWSCGKTRTCDDTCEEHRHARASKGGHKPTTQPTHPQPKRVPELSTTLMGWFGVRVVEAR
jgi:hypothetical protein